MSAAEGWTALGLLIGLFITASIAIIEINR
jgi:hypothetical protein